MLWSLVGWLVFPSYARLGVPTTARVLAWIQPHDIAVELVHDSPWVSWRFATEEHGKPITVLWRVKPIFIRRRTTEEIDEAESVDLKDLKCQE